MKKTMALAAALIAVIMPHPGQRSDLVLVENGVSRMPIVFRPKCAIMRIAVCALTGVSARGQRIGATSEQPQRPVHPESCNDKGLRNDHDDTRISIDLVGGARA